VPRTRLLIVQHAQSKQTISLFTQETLSMANLGNFNAHEVDPTSQFDPVPAGKYLAVISASEQKETKSRKGSYLELTFEIVEGDYKGRKLWARLNLDNPNETAVKIARAELSAICHATGVMQPKDSMDLHDLPLTITVKCKKRDDTDEMTNEIKGYAKKEAAYGQPQQAATSSPPWRR
jgi:hypothetical protein